MPNKGLFPVTLHGRDVTNASFFPTWITNVIIIFFYDVEMKHPCLSSLFCKYSILDGVHLCYFDFFLSFYDHRGSDYHIFSAFLIKSLISLFISNCFWEWFRTKWMWLIFFIKSSMFYLAIGRYDIRSEYLQNQHSQYYCCRTIFDAWKVESVFSSIAFSLTCSPHNFSCKVIQNNSRVIIRYSWVVSQS